MEKIERIRGLRFGLLDVLIFLAIAAGIFTMAKLSIPVSAVESLEGNMTFVVELQKKEDYFFDKVHKGDKIYENLKGIYLGEIIDVQIEPHTMTSPDVLAKVQREARVEGLYNLYLTVEAKADWTGGATVVNGYEVAVGKEMFVRTKGVASPGYCVAMDLGGRTR